MPQRRLPGNHLPKTVKRFSVNLASEKKSQSSSLVSPSQAATKSLPPISPASTVSPSPMVSKLPGPRGVSTRAIRVLESGTHFLVNRSRRRLFVHSASLESLMKSVFSALEEKRKQGVFDPFALREGPALPEEQLYVALKAHAIQRPQIVLEAAKEFLQQKKSTVLNQDPLVKLVEKMVKEAKREDQQAAKFSKRLDVQEKILKAKSFYQKVRQTRPAFLFRILLGGPKLWKRIPGFAIAMEDKRMKELAKMVERMYKKKETIRGRMRYLHKVRLFAKIHGDSPHYQAAETTAQLRVDQAKKELLELQREFSVAEAAHYQRDRLYYQQAKKWEKLAELPAKVLGARVPKR